MQVAVVTDLNIDNYTLKNNLPSKTKYFVCSLQAGNALYKRLENSRTPGDFDLFRGSGFSVLGSGPIAKGEYTVDNIVYSIWGRGQGFLISGLEENKTMLDREIRAAFRGGQAPAVAKPVNNDGFETELGDEGDTLYCKRWIGKTVLGPDCDGQCGPGNGPNCPACKITQAKLTRPDCITLDQLHNSLERWIRDGMDENFRRYVNNAGMNKNRASKTVLGAVLESVCEEDPLYRIRGLQSSEFTQNHIVLSELTFKDNSRGPQVREPHNVIVDIVPSDITTLLTIKHVRSSDAKPHGIYGPKR
jgi:hypothetical protein